MTWGFFSEENCFGRPLIWETKTCHVCGSSFKADNFSGAIEPCSFCGEWTCPDCMDDCSCPCEDDE